MSTRKQAAVPIKVAPFDAVSFLVDDPEQVAEYLSVALENRDPGAFLHAVKNVAKARGMSQVAKDAGLTRASLYKAFAPGTSPKHDTVRRVLGALGVKIHVSAT